MRQIFMRRSIRYQAAIVFEDRLLLLKVLDRRTGRLFWVFPGGGREAGETEEECIEREVREETYLAVAVARFLFEVPDVPEGNYDRLRTYLCTIQEGAPHPGTEPKSTTCIPSFGRLAGLISGSPSHGIR